ncbi:hypothetical protein RB195_010701 [Necator americanus]|uniref:DnaJ homolog subfamily C member 2 n=1 Tax=Necator americanus TaxID=51031 RepID=A0ABR1CZ46_NECAM
MHCVATVIFLLTVVEDVEPAWNSEELALYDLVEEIKANFYDVFGITKEASIGDIKKAYRRLSLEWHPDRNSAPDASEKFRQIVSIYEILKSTELREKYDNVLEFGLPDWRQPIYYYRKMRKLAWYEAIIVLMGVSTIAHYLMMWAAYYEKYLVLKQNLRKSRKRDKKGEAENSMTQLHDALDVFRPRFHDLLPFIVARTSWNLLKAIPFLIQEQLSRKDLEVKEEQNHEVRRPAPTPRVPEFTYEVATDLKAVSTNNPEMSAKYMSEAEESQKKQSGAPWSCDELYQLHLIQNYIIFWVVLGTPNRWECMARVLNRTAQDVTTMAGKLKHMKQEEYEKLAMGQQSNAVVDIRSGKTEETTGISSTASSYQEWTQTEQKQLEAALQQYPKGCEDRWDKIAAAVPTKSMEQCQQRLKELVELVRRKKASKAQ